MEKDGKDAAYSRLTTIISSVGNFSIQYNFGVVSICLALMVNTVNTTDGNPAFDITDGEISLITSVILAGAVIGQLTMGYVGDAFGRGPAMMLTNCLTAIGAFGCALLAWNPYVSTVLVIFRFILGVGVGGKYPLSAMMRAEGVSEKEHGPTEHAKNFFWQVPGAVSPYILALILYNAFDSKTGSSNFGIVSMQFRVIFAAGAIPSLYVAWLCRGIPESTEFSQNRESNPLKVACRHPEYLFQLVGTGGTWFLYDFTIFGFFLNSPSILKEVFGDSEDITAICWQYLVISLGGLFGTILSIPMATRLGLKAMQNVGFMSIAASTLLLALAIELAPDAHGEVATATPLTVQPRY
jgi:MFS family permease